MNSIQKMSYHPMLECIRVDVGFSYHYKASIFVLWKHVYIDDQRYVEALSRMFTILALIQCIRYTDSLIIFKEEDAFFIELWNWNE